MYLKDKPQYFTFTEKCTPTPFIVSWRRTLFVFFVHNIDFLQTQKRSLTKSCKTENVKWRTVVWRASQDWWSNCHWFFKYWPMGWDGTQLDSGLWLIRLEFHRTTSIGAFGHLHVFVFVVAFAFVYEYSMDVDGNQIFWSAAEEQMWSAATDWDQLGQTRGKPAVVSFLLQLCLIIITLKVICFLLAMLENSKVHLFAKWLIWSLARLAGGNLDQTRYCAIFNIRLGGKQRSNCIVADSEEDAGGSLEATVQLKCDRSDPVYRYNRQILDGAASSSSSSS